MPIDPTYNQTATMREKKEMLSHDKIASTYHSRAQSELGLELGRFSHLAKEQVVTGSTGVPQYPRQVGTPWSEPDPNQEPPLGYSVSELPPPEGLNPPENVSSLSPKSAYTPIEVEQAFHGFKRRL